MCPSFPYIPTPCRLRAHRARSVAGGPPRPTPTDHPHHGVRRAPDHGARSSGVFGRFRALSGVFGRFRAPENARPKTPIGRFLSGVFGRFGGGFGGRFPTRRKALARCGHSDSPADTPPSALRGTTPYICSDLLLKNKPGPTAATEVCRLFPIRHAESHLESLKCRINTTSNQHQHINAHYITSEARAYPLSAPCRVDSRSP